MNKKFHQCMRLLGAIQVTREIRKYSWYESIKEGYKSYQETEEFLKDWEINYQKREFKPQLKIVK